MLKIFSAFVGVALCCGVVWWWQSSAPTEVVPVTSEVEVAPDVADEPVQADPAEDADLPEDSTVQTTEESSLDLGLGPAALEGIVLSPFGPPAAGATVVLMRTRLTPELEESRGVQSWRLTRRDPEGRSLRDVYGSVLKDVAQLVADDEGKFSFLGVAPGEYIVAASNSDSLVTPSNTVFQVTAESSKAVAAEVFLREAAELSGRVLDPEGMPVPGAEIRALGNILESEDGFVYTFLPLEELFAFLLNPIARDTVTGDDGDFVLLGLPTLEYQVTAIASPWAPAEVLSFAPTDEPLEIQLEAGGTVVGWVEDPEGSPVPAAEVRLVREDKGASFFESRREPLVMQSDEHGSFLFEEVAAGQYRVESKAPGFQTGRFTGLRVASGESQEVVVIMKSGHVIEGVVLADGKPVSDVQVSVSSRSGRWWGSQPQAKTDAEGFFRFDTLQDRKYYLQFIHPDWAPQFAETKVDLDPLEVNLDPGVTLFAVVQDEEGQPIPEARAWLGRRGERTRSTKTNAEGGLSFPGLGDEKYWLTIRAEGFTIYRETLEASEADLGVITLAQSVAIRGVVLGPDGAGLAGARVRADLVREDKKTRRERANVTSSHDGTFELQLPVATGRWKVSAEYSMLLAPSATEVDCSGGSVDDVEVELGWGAGVRGFVLDSNGQPLGGAQVSLAQERRRGWGGGRRGHTRTRADGFFQITGLKEGRYRLQGQAAGFARERVGGLELKTDRQLEQDLVLEVERILRGRVYDISRRPMSGVRIRVWGAGAPGTVNTQSRLDGTFEVGGLSDSPIRVRASLAGYLNWSIKDHEVRNRSLDIELEESFELTGEVFDARGGPVAKARVRVTGQRKGKRRPNFQGRTDEDGVFRITGIPEGTYTVSASARGFLQSRMPELQLPWDVPPNGISFSLEQGGAIRGLIRASQGGVVNNARVNIYRTYKHKGKNRSTRVQRVRSGKDGRFEAVSLRDGAYEVRIDHANYVSDRSDKIQVSPNQREAFFEATLERGAEVTGRVVSSRDDLRKGRVVLESTTGPRLVRRVRPDKSHRYRIRSLPPGEYILYYQPPGSRTREGERSVRLGAEQSFELDLFP